MSTENNPRLRQMAKDLKRANAMLARGESLQVIFIDVWFAGVECGINHFAKTQRAKTSRVSKKENRHAS